jgi:hypothetical protein
MSFTLPITIMLIVLSPVLVPAIIAAGYAAPRVYTRYSAMPHVDYLRPPADGRLHAVAAS